MSLHKAPHIPVMLQEVLSFFEGRHLETYVDGTVGAGGHARAILEAHPEIKRMIACDRDPSALLLAQQNLSPWEEKVELVHSNFSKIDHILSEKGMDSVDGFFLIWESHPCNWIEQNEDLVLVKKGP